MEKEQKSVRYTATPAQFDFPLIPVPKKRTSMGKNPSSLAVNRVRFPGTSLAKADAKTEELVKHCEQLYRRRRLEELVNTIRKMPHLAFNQRIREILLELAQLKRKLHPFGRPPGIYREHPLILAAMIEELISKKIVSNQELAFAWLERFGISASTARDLWYQAWSDPRFQPLFHKQEARTHLATFDETVALKQAKVLEPGKTASHTVAHPILGDVTVTLTAIESEKNSHNT